MSSLVSQRLQSSQNYPFCIGSSSCWSYHILGDCIHKEVIPYKEPFWRIIVHSGRNQGEDELSGLSHVPCLPAEIISLLRAEMVHRHSMRVGVELMNRSYFPGVLGSWGISIIPLLISAQCSAVLPLSWVHGGRACSPSPHPPPRAESEHWLQLFSAWVFPSTHCVLELPKQKLPKYSKLLHEFWGSSKWEACVWLQTQPFKYPWAAQRRSYGSRLRFFCLREEIQLCQSFRKKALSLLLLVRSSATRFWGSAKSDSSLASV